MALQEFERRLERLVEGAFAKAFRSRLTPVELGRRMTREMDVRRTVGLHGVIAPNQFSVQVGAADHENLSKFENSLVNELAGYAREHARTEGYALLGPVEVTLECDDTLGRGEFTVVAEVVESEGGRTPGAVVLEDGTRVQIGDGPVTIGRHGDCDIVVSEREVSRRHAEVRRSHGGFLLVDLDSMNGTRVNGAGIREHRLVDGDRIEIGNHVFRFEAS